MTSPFTVSAQVCDEPDPIDWLPDPHGVLAWLRGDEGFVGWGTAASFRPIGRERFGEAQRWWNGFLQSTVPDDATSVAPDGPIGFVRMAYADESDQSLVTVPEVLLDRRNGVRRTTRVTSGTPAQAMSVRARPVSAPTDLHYSAGSVSPSDHRKAVAAAVARIDGGQLEKVVLANGNAEFAVALRCAQLGSRTARLFAGGGIVAGSRPDREDAEVEAKLNAFRSALGDCDRH